MRDNFSDRSSNNRFRQQIWRGMVKTYKHDYA